MEGKYIKREDISKVDAFDQASDSIPLGLINYRYPVQLVWPLPGTHCED